MTAVSRQAGTVGGSHAEFPERPGGLEHPSWTPSGAADGIDFMVWLTDVADRFFVDGFCGLGRGFLRDFSIDRFG